MNWGALIVIVGLIFFLGVIPLAFLQASLLKKGYGPEQRSRGPLVMQGRLVCQNWKAPSLGKKLQFDYAASLTGQTEDFWGEYHYPSQNNGKRQPIYTGELFLTYHQGAIKGRSDRKVVQGELGQVQGNLQLGFPQRSLLGWMNSPFQFRIDGGNVLFLNTSKGNGAIGHGSKLTINERSIVGRLVDWKQAWVIEVDIQYRRVAPELIVLAILMMSNDIFTFHNR